MAEKKFKIIFKGETIPDMDLARIKQNLAILFKVDVKQIEPLFTGKSIVLKDNVNLDFAQKYMFQMEEAGAICEIAEMETAPPPPPPAAAMPPEPAPPAQPPKAAPPQTPPQPAKQVQQAPAAPPAQKPQPPKPTQSAPPRQTPPPQTPPPQTSPPQSPPPPPPLEPEPEPEPEAPEMDFGNLAPAEVPSQQSRLSGDQARQFNFKQPKKKSGILVVLSFIVVISTVLFIIFNPFSGSDSVEYRRPAPSPDAETPVKQETRPKPPAPEESRTLESGGLTETYNDPNGFFSISLPQGYTVTEKSTEQKSLASFIYPDKALVKISASPRQAEWDPHQAMMQHVAAIQGGQDRDFANYSIQEHQPVNIVGLNGYEILLEMGDRIGHVYGVLAASDVIITISIITFGQENHDIIDLAVQENLIVY
jgi:hypothetical protein